MVPSPRWSDENLEMALACPPPNNNPPPGPITNCPNTLWGRLPETIDDARAQGDKKISISMVGSSVVLSPGIAMTKTPAGIIHYTILYIIEYTPYVQRRIAQRRIVD